MLYTLSNGARKYDKRLHYSLYGGVEYMPDRSLAIKELLPLAAIPAVSIALLVALLNFHIPKLSPQGGSGTGSLSVPGSGISAVLSANNNPASTNSKPTGTRDAQGSNLAAGRGGSSTSPVGGFYGPNA
jgi:hypothetical protein